LLRYTGVVSVEEMTLLGYPFRVLREVPEMPRFDNEFLDCSVYLYPSVEHAERGEKIGGSGFLVTVPAAGPGWWLLDGECPNPTCHHVYVVSNRHNLINQTRPKPVVRLNTHDGKTDIIPADAARWFCSDKHDLAVLPINLRVAYKFLCIDVRSFLTKEIAIANDVGIGDEVFMVGRFINHEGKQRNSPTIRFGHVSMMPAEDDPVSHESNPSGSQVSFLVEVHSVPGYSGSPVMVRPFPTKKLPAVTHATAFENVYQTAPHFQMVAKPLIGGPWLLGVQWGVLTLPDPADPKDREKRHFTGLSGVVPAWYLREFLDSEGLKTRRMEEQKHFVEEAQSHGTEVTGSGPLTP
jgi:hypothetical protein